MSIRTLSALNYRITIDVEITVRESSGEILNVVF